MIQGNYSKLEVSNFKQKTKENKKFINNMNNPGARGDIDGKAAEFFVAEKLLRSKDVLKELSIKEKEIVDISVIGNTNKPDINIKLKNGKQILVSCKYTKGTYVSALEMPIKRIVLKCSGLSSETISGLIAFEEAQCSQKRMTQKDRQILKDGLKTDAEKFLRFVISGDQSVDYLIMLDKKTQKYTLSTIDEYIELLKTSNKNGTFYSKMTLTRSSKGVFQVKIMNSNRV